ncbi:MAG: ComEC family competence protein, partial [bacterium]|nr:ComEC family competence protein [bacterium]
IIPDGFDQAIRASLYQPMDARINDRVWIRGVIAPPENFENFDYVGYLQRHNVFAVLKKPKVIVLKHEPCWWQKPIEGFRAVIFNRSEAVFSEQSRGLILGMLIGDRQFIIPDVAESFKVVGMTHIVAVSGYNMTIIAAACAGFAWYMGRRLSGLSTIVVVLTFAMIAGGAASVVRAAIMALLVVAAQLCGRLYTSMYALIWAAGIMVLQNPRIVLWDVGFQLSVAATLGVLYAYKLRSADESTTYLSESLRPTLGAIIATAPLIAYHFQTISLISPLANVLLLPLVPWIMLLGTLSLIPVVGVNIGFAASIITHLMINIVTRLAAIPFGSTPFSISAFVLIIFYLCTIGIIQIILRRRKGVVHGE